MINMKALKVIIFILLLLVALFLIIGLFLPKSAYTEQSIEIKAPSYMVFSQINHLPNWEAWSPFAEDDPEMQVIYGDISEGVGGSYSWTSKHGDGSMTIRESEPDSSIVFDMEFVGQGKAYSSWKFVQTDSITLVTWGFGMDSLSYPLSRYFGLFLGSMMKPSFDKGLKKLKQLVESMDIIPQGRTGEIIERVVPDQYILSIKDSCTADEFEEFFEHSFSMMVELLNSQDLEMTAPIMTIWHTWNPEGYSVVEAAIPVGQIINKGIPEGTGIISRALKGGNVVYATHYGSQESSGMTYEAIEAYMKNESLIGRGDVWEIYITHGISEPDPSKWEFQIVYPLK